MSKDQFLKTDNDIPNLTYFLGQKMPNGERYNGDNAYIPPAQVPSKPPSQVIPEAQQPKKKPKDFAWYQQMLEQVNIDEMEA